MSSLDEFAASWIARWSWNSLVWLAFALLLPSLRAQSQGTSIQPYATLDRQAVTYRGPAIEAEPAPGRTAVIGLILPMQGPPQMQGRALREAAQVALEQEQERGSLPDGRKLALVVRDQSGAWGQASSEILRLVEQDHAVVVMTSADGNIAHQAEQIANKISFPILTLASDPTTTQTNIPWIFRMGPSDADQARAFGQRIYAELGRRKVLLIAQTDHDGRVGRSEFEKMAREMKAPTPDVLELPASSPKAALVIDAVQMYSPDAIVIWTGEEATAQLVATVRKFRPMIPVFLSTKSAQLETQRLSASLCIAAMMEEQKPGDSFAVVSLPTRVDGSRCQFEQSYRARTGNEPGIGAFEIYEAVRLAAEGLRAVGANRILLRDYLAKDGQFRGTTAFVPFDPAGNSTEEFTIVPVATPSAALTQ